MKTEDLIGLLAADTVPPAPLRPARIGAAVVAAIILMAGLFLALAGMRDGLWQVMQRPEVVAKTLLPLVLFALALPLALRQARPEAAAPRWGLVLPLLAVGGGLWIWAYATLPPAARFAEWMVWAVVECLGSILLMSLLPLGLLLGLMRRGASIAPMRAGALSGLAVGCGVAAGYSLFCTKDNPIFYVTWYGVAVLVVVAMGAVSGARVLRW